MCNWYAVVRNGKNRWNCRLSEQRFFFALVVISGLITTSSQVDQSSEIRTRASPTSLVKKMDERTIRGTIVSIMESWPLQLSIASGSERVSVVLIENAEIVRCGKRVSPEDLRVDQFVRLEGKITARIPAAMMAYRLEILN